jgi:hypothetical protein
MDAASSRKNLNFDQQALKVILHEMMVPGVSFERIQEIKTKLQSNKVFNSGLGTYHLTGEDENEYFF